MRKLVRRFKIIMALIWACVVILCLVIDPQGYGFVAVMFTIFIVVGWLAGNARQEKERRTIYVRHLRDD